MASFILTSILFRIIIVSAKHEEVQVIQDSRLVTTRDTTLKEKQTTMLLHKVVIKAGTLNKKETNRLQIVLGNV